MFWFVVLCTLFPATFALSCDYTDIEVCPEKELALCPEYTSIKIGNPLELSDFTKGEIATFTITNPNNFEVFAVFNYKVIGHSKGKHSKGLKIGSLNYSTFKHYCFDGKTMGECSINENVSYYISKPQILYPKEVLVEKNKTICKICPNGKECLNNGTKCKSDKECGCGYCNFAGYCGPFTRCPKDLKNCKNESCLKPSIKKAGETYSCEWECESNKGDGGICKDKPENIFTKWRDLLIISGVICFIVIISLVYLYEKEIKPKLHIWRALNKYKKRYHNLFYDKKTGYLRFENGKKEFLHRYIYREKFKLRSGHVVHHIDVDKLNNEDFNLIDIPYDKHKYTLKHIKIKKGKWRQGLKELMKQLNMTEKDLPKHVLDHLKK